MENEFSHICSFCRQPYGIGRVPKFLPCFHTFCLSCLTVLEASVITATSDSRTGDTQQTADGQAGKQTDSADNSGNEDTTVKPVSEGQSGDVTSTGVGDAEKRTFLCPTCQAPVVIPKGGVAGLQTNFYLTHEDASSQPSASPAALCDMCEKSSKQPATHACQQCSVGMCSSCRRAHDRLLSGHQVMPLTGPGQHSTEAGGGCPLHDDQAFKFYCRQCDVAICLHCKLTAHEGHKTVDIASVEAESRAELTALIKVAQEQLQVVESSMRRVERDERELTRHAQSTLQQIKNRYEDIVARVDQSRDELMEEFSETEERAKIQLRDQKILASATAETLSALVSRADWAGEHDAVTLKKDLEEALLSEDLLEHHKLQAARRGAWSRWIYDVAGAPTADVAAGMGKLVEGNGCDVARSPSAEGMDGRAKGENVNED